jgi:hypothetical protein
MPDDHLAVMRWVIAVTFGNTAVEMCETGQVLKADPFANPRQRLNQKGIPIKRCNHVFRTKRKNEVIVEGWLIGKDKGGKVFEYDTFDCIEMRFLCRVLGKIGVESLDVTRRTTNASMFKKCFQAVDDTYEV